MEQLKRLFSYYRAYHMDGPLMLRFLGLFGALSFPLFYLLRFTKSTAPYDDMPLRLMNFVLCLLLIFKDQWPRRLQPFYFAYSYAALVVALPMTFMYTSLRNGGGLVGVGNTLMAVFFVILLTDWRNMLVMLGIGFSSAVLLYIATAPDPSVPVEYVARLPILLLVIVGGSVFKYASERATAERVRRAYASLAGSIAHEMRNPLSQLKHSLHSMQNALPRPTMDAHAQVLQAAQIDSLYSHLAQGEVAVRRGLQVISMTLDEVSARPPDKAGFAFLSAAQVCHKAVQEYGYESEDERSRVSVRVVSDFVFRGDETAFLFVLFNLIKNALYYAGAHPHARLVVTVDQGRVLVRDTGPGIAPEALGQLFEPFGSSGKSGGTGLGLAYCARVVRAFGGTIRCDSVRGQYTEFTMVFPRAGEDEQEAHRQAVLARARGAFAGKRLLVVDDDAALRAITRHKLLPLQAAVDEAADGRQAMALLSGTRYDLVLLDLSIPVMDGYAVAEAVRAGLAPANQATRIVAYTSEPAHLARVKTEKAGFDAMVSKPCDQVPLLQALCQALDSPVRQPEAAHGALAGRSILLADDNAYNRKAVAAYLRHAGASVTEAGDGEAALALLHGMPRCDAVLLDIDMPRMGGLDAARAIRAQASAHQLVPIVALTAYSGAAMRQAAQSAGMSGLMTKPVDAQALCDRLCQLWAGAGEPAPAAPAGHDSTSGDMALLDVARLENYARLGMLQELVNDYLPDITSLIDRLEEAVVRGERQACMDALHSLVGMSGEAGAYRLHHMIRRIYIVMMEDPRHPAASGWVSDVRALAGETAQELHKFTISRGRAS